MAMRWGMNLCLAAVLGAGIVPKPCRAQTKELPDSLIGRATAPLLLLSRHDVQTDLAMSTEQVQEAEREITALYLKASALKGQKGEQVVAARRAIDEEQQRWLEERLSETQRKRLVQVDLQWEGPAALVTRPALAELIGLSAEQHAALKQAVDESRRQRAGGTAVREVLSKLARQTLELLTPPQRERWKAMLGRPFAFQLHDDKPAQH
jgi:hypothetical protein